MPLTPLHLAAGLPVKDLGKKKFSLTAFVLANLLIDLEPGVVMFFGMDRLGYPIHGASHSLLALGLIPFAAVGARLLVRCKPVPLLLGALWGIVSHLLLDALVHADIGLFPVAWGWPQNPFYLGYHAEISLALAAVLVIYLVRWVAAWKVPERCRKWQQRLFNG